MTNDRNNLAWLVLFIIGITTYRGLALLNYDYALYTDEAYYWLWSKDLAWGYYSKPPVIAVLINAATTVCGDTETCIRSLGVLLYPLTTLAVFLIGTSVANSRVGVWAALLFSTMPAVSVSSLVASTDVPLLLLWSWSLLFFIKALQSNRWHWWLLVGIFGGVGMLSKYNFAIFFISGLLLMALSKSHRHHLLSIKPWSTVLVSLILFAPNLMWNINNDFPTITHTTEISGVMEDAPLHWDKMSAFLLSQFIVFGIIPFALLITLSMRLRWWQQQHLLMLMSMPFLLIISAVALFGEANENWASPAYVGGSLLVAVWLHEKNWRGLLVTAVLVNIAMMLSITHLDEIKAIAGIEQTSANDPYKRLRGWREFAAQVDERMSDSTIVVSSSRTLLSHYLYEAKLPISRSASWNPDNGISHHFDLVTTLEQNPQQDYLLLNLDSNDCLLNSFTRLEVQQPITVEVYAGYSIHTEVMAASGFKGYQCQ